MKTTMTVAQVAAASGVDVTTLRNWLAHTEFRFGSKTLTSRWQFSRTDAIGIALAGALVQHGQSPKRALHEAHRLVQRASDLDVLVIGSVDTRVSAILVPADLELPRHNAFVIALAPLRERVDNYLARFQR